MIGEMMPMFILLIFIPFQILIPLIFVINDFGLGTLIALAVVLVFMPFQSLLFRMYEFIGVVFNIYIT
jgi:hypothetical protein